MEKMTTDKFIEMVKNMTVLELSETVKALEEEFGVSGMPMMAAAAAAPVAAEGAKEEKSEFDVMLKSVGEKKINVIKVVKTVTGLGLKEAKDMVDGAPSKVKAAVAKAEAEEIKKQLEEAGATVELA